jgi:hypothetical protein
MTLNVIRAAAGPSSNSRRREARRRKERAGAMRSARTPAGPKVKR